MAFVLNNEIPRFTCEACGEVGRLKVCKCRLNGKNVIAIEEMSGFPDKRLGFEQQMAAFLAQGDEEGFTETLYQFLNQAFGFQHEVKKYETAAAELTDIRRKLTYLLRVYLFLDEYRDQIFSSDRDLKIKVATLLDPFREVGELLSAAARRLGPLAIAAQDEHFLQEAEEESKEESEEKQPASVVY